MKAFAKAFYESAAWRRTRAYILKRDAGLCVRCGAPGCIVHHKTELTPRNIDDPMITLNEDNLETVCRTCHAIIHEGTPPLADGLAFDADGNVIDNELRKMGAAVTVDGRVAVVEGVETLRGASVDACDLRAGAAMVIAGLCARGVTLVEDIQFIERGYENFVGKLRLLGADIRIIDEPDGTERGTAVAG